MTVINHHHYYCALTNARIGLIELTGKRTSSSRISLPFIGSRVQTCRSTIRCPSTSAVVVMPEQPLCWRPGGICYRSTLQW